MSEIVTELRRVTMGSMPSPAVSTPMPMPMPTPSQSQSPAYSNPSDTVNKPEQTQQAQQSQMPSIPSAFPDLDEITLVTVNDLVFH